MSPDPSFIFCDYSEVKSRIWDVSNQIVKEGFGAILVVDGCPLKEARRLNQLALTEDSQLRVITIGPEGVDHEDHCVMIRPTKADRATIKGILKAGLPKAKSDELDYIAELCDGFPRIAVLASVSYEKKGILKSVDDVAQQILHAAGAERETVRALECLSLFERLSPDENPQVFDGIAEKLVHMKGELMYENLVIAAGQHLVNRDSGVMNVQPAPIADFLALRRLEYIRPSTLVNFLTCALPQYRDAMLARWRFLARSRTLRDVICMFLGGSFAGAKILGPDAAPYLLAFARVEPDAMTNALFSIISHMTLDELAAIPLGDEMVDTLRLLAGRQDNFEYAALMIVRLAAVANTEPERPIVKLLGSLFQVALAGTQADDRRRRSALNRALDEDDPRIRRAGVEALGAMIQTHILRFGKFEQVGTEPYRPEWTPPDIGTIHDYFKWALDRLLEIWRKAPELRRSIEAHVAGDLRNLLMPELLPTIDEFIREVVATSGHYFGATKSIGDWLYFDRPEKPTRFSEEVRALYDATVPKDPVDQALLYSRFCVSDIHDPDKSYAQDRENPDFEYSARCAQSLAAGIARNPEQLKRVICAMASQEINSPQAFAHTLAFEVSDPLATFEQAVEVLDASGNSFGLNFVGSLLSALDRRLADRDHDRNRLEYIAKESTTLKANQMYIWTSLQVTDQRLDALTNEVRTGNIIPRQVVVISYGRGLDDVSTKALGKLITALIERGEQGSAKAALEILCMVTLDHKVLTQEIIDIVKLVILSPSITDEAVDSPFNTDSSYGRLLRLLDVSGAIDDDFARNFAHQIEQACRATGERHGRLSEALRGALAIVVKRAPKEVWMVLAAFYEIGTPVERERLNSVTSVSKPFAFNVSRIGPGTLFETPLDIMLEWAADDPDARIDFLVSFFPILEQNGEDWTWHPALQILAERYGRSKRFRDALRLRIYPSSWSGSLKPHLESFKEPLAAWADDCALGDWASNMLHAVTRSLKDESFGS